MALGRLIGFNMTEITSKPAIPEPKSDCWTQTIVHIPHIDPFLRREAAHGSIGIKMVLHKLHKLVISLQL